MHARNFSIFNNFIKKHLILRDKLKLKNYSTEFSIIFDLIRLYSLIFIIVIMDFDPF